MTNSRIVILLAACLLPYNAYASDFTVLTTGLWTFVIACLLVFLCIKACHVAKTKDRSFVVPYTIGSFLLTFIGCGLISDESSHMAQSDLYGMLGVVLIPGVITVVLPLYLGKPPSTKDDTQ